MMNRIKTLQELNLLDRFLFSEVMADNEILEDVLEIILGHPVPLKDKAQAEKELRRTPQNKSVYFDVYGEDIRDVAYDMEVQQKNTKDLPKRTRYYNGMIDLNMLHPGEDYSQLKDAYVIMIMPFDLFGEGKYKYTFHMSCDEIPGLKLHDGATRIFLNTRGTDAEGVSEELIQLLRYFEQTTEENAAGSHSRKIENLQKRVEEIKKNEEVGIRYMNAFEEKMWERREGEMIGKKIGERIGEERGKRIGEELGRKEGVAQGERTKQREIARKMVEKNLDFVLIKEMTGLTEQELNTLKKKNQSRNKCNSNHIF